MNPGYIPNVPAQGDKQISAEFLQEMAKGVASLLRVEGDGVGVSFDGGSLQLFDMAAQLDVFVAKINGESGGSYGWVEQRPASVASPTGFEDRPDGRTGTTTVDPAKALSGVKYVLDGTLVVMFPGWHTDVGSARMDRGWKFLYSPFCFKPLLALEYVTAATLVTSVQSRIGNFTVPAKGLWHITGHVVSKVVYSGGASGAFVVGLSIAQTSGGTTSVYYSSQLGHAISVGLPAGTYTQVSPVTFMIECDGPAEIGVDAIATFGASYTVDISASLGASNFYATRLPELITGSGSTPAHFPATGASTGAGTVAWSNPTQIITAGGGGATAALTAGDTTKQLDASDFKFVVPAVAITPTGLSVVINRKATGGGTIKDTSVRLLVGGVAAGADKADTVTLWPSAYGDAIYTWNLAELNAASCDVADLNLANFGIRLVAECTSVAGTADVDYVTVTASYTW